ncbi:MAG: hypothetical protein IKR05_14135 [Prevotella sp.]|nr:hypothetical protein [Prevotella sp.]
MIDASAAQRTGTSDEIAEAAAFLWGEHARFNSSLHYLVMVVSPTFNAGRTPVFHSYYSDRFYFHLFWKNEYIFHFIIPAIHS